MHQRSTYAPSLVKDHKVDLKHALILDESMTGRLRNYALHGKIKREGYHYALFTEKQEPCYYHFYIVNFRRVKMLIGITLMR